ncbi:hypothetical protein EV132_1421 [Rhizobium sullae]|uniref:Uncharacterized protein n=1 Tax=Rhizobium sullae TaxID=50338 RepID=A0A4R3PSE0_RHISU|nr:hypothetical protein EV132_1421 [Rhizobium sullae]
MTRALSAMIRMEILAMSRYLIKVGTRRLCETSGGCAGHGFPLRHCADPMDVDGEG